jgi:hypothetical protein
MAHHFARLVYRMLRYGQNFANQYESKFRMRIKWLEKEVRSLNLHVLAIREETSLSENLCVGHNQRLKNGSD